MRPEESRALLREIERRLDVDLDALWSASTSQGVSSDQFRALMLQAMPETVLEAASLAADVGVVAVDDVAPATYTAVRGDLPPVERLQSSTVWALNTAWGEDALTLIKGTATRAMMDGFRETVVENTDRVPGARWARYASSTACGFCRMLVTRHVGPSATFYGSEAAAGRVVGRGQEMTAAERRDRAAGRTQSSSQSRRFIAGGRRTRGTQKLGDRYHDFCRCLPVMIPAGEEYDPPDYVHQWNQDYIDATRKAAAQGRTRGEYGAIDPNVIARLMDPH